MTNQSISPSEIVLESAKSFASRLIGRVSSVSDIVLALDPKLVAESLSNIAAKHGKRAPRIADMSVFASVVAVVIRVQG